MLSGILTGSINVKVQFAVTQSKKDSLDLMAWLFGIKTAIDNVKFHTSNNGQD